MIIVTVLFLLYCCHIWPLLSAQQSDVARSGQINQLCHPRACCCSQSLSLPPATANICHPCHSLLLPTHSQTANHWKKMSKSSPINLNWKVFKNSLFCSISYVYVMGFLPLLWIRQKIMTWRDWESRQGKDLRLGNDPGQTHTMAMRHFTTPTLHFTFSWSQDIQATVSEVAK